MAAKRGKQAYRGNEKQSWPAWIWLCLGVCSDSACRR
jgi:hypothetical protein